MLNKSSCFINALEIAYAPGGPTAEELDALYRLYAPSCKPEETGYHVTVVNAVWQEKFQIGLTEICLFPNDFYAGAMVNPDKLQEVVLGWFKRPGFRCLVCGPNANGVEHANAFVGNGFIDPMSPGNLLAQPTVQPRLVYLLSLPHEGQPSLPPGSVIGAGRKVETAEQAVERLEAEAAEKERQAEEAALDAKANEWKDGDDV